MIAKMWEEGMLIWESLEDEIRGKRFHLLALKHNIGRTRTKKLGTRTGLGTGLTPISWYVPSMRF